MRYEGIGCGIVNWNTPAPALFRSAAMTATSSFGVRIVASYVMRTAGVSCNGMNDRAWIACAWLNRNGCFWPAVCAGVSHCSPLAPGDVMYVTRARSAPGGITMRRALPNAGVGASSLNGVSTHAADPIAASVFEMVRSRVSSTSSVADGSRRSNDSDTWPDITRAPKSVVRSSTRCVVTKAEMLA